MKSVLLLIAVFACLGNQNVLAQTCYSNLRCNGGTTSGATYDQCCGPVIQNNALSRSFKSGSTCSPCYVLGLAQASYTLSESSTVYSIRLRVLSPTDPVIYGRPRLRLKGIPGTAMTDDFSLPSSDILITSFSGTDVAVTLVVDGIAGESTESFVITSQQPLVSGSGDVKFLFRTTTINIRDADNPSYKFLLTEYAQFEGSDSPCNEVTVMQTSSRVESDVHLLVTPITYAQYTARSATDSSLPSIDTYHGGRPTAATYDQNGNKDFNNTALKIMFPAGSEKGSIRSVAIEVFDDDIDEYLEGYILILDVDTSQTALSTSFIPSRRTALVNIYDDDPFYFGFEQQEYTLNEYTDEGIQEFPFSAAPGNATEKLVHFSLDLSPVKGNFKWGASGDFSFGSVRPTIRFSDSINIVTPNVINDDIIEGEEIGQFKILKYEFSPFDGFAPRFQSVRIILTDDDVPTVTLVAPLSVPESIVSFQANITLPLPLSGLSQSFEVDILDTGITATRLADYSLTPRSVRFQGAGRPGCCKRSVLCTIRDDNIAEPDEIFSLTVKRSSASAEIPVSYLTQTVDVKIIDNDIARIGFEFTALGVIEGSSATLSIAVLGDTALGRNVIVRFSTADITAIGGNDYTSTITDLTFNATVIRHSVQVGIIPDGISEGAEQFKAILHMMNDGCVKVNLNPSIATVTITHHV